MDSIFGHIRRVAGILLTDEEVPEFLDLLFPSEEPPKSAEKAAAERTVYEPESVRVYFSAPDRASTEEVSEGGNFQWTRYELTFKRVKLDKKGKIAEVKHYVYKTPLFAWGAEAPGGQEVIDADPAITEADITIDEAKRNMPNVLSGPELYPAGLKGTYVNTHRTATGKDYTYDEFNRKFRRSDFYKVVTKTHKLENP